MTQAKTDKETIRAIWQMRAKDVLAVHTDHPAGERWPYSRIKDELGVSDYTISNYAERANLTKATPLEQRIQRACKLLDVDPPDDHDPGPAADASASEEVSLPEEAIEREWAMPLDEDGVDGFLPDDDAADPLPDPDPEPDPSPDEPAPEDPDTMSDTNPDPDEESDDAEHVVRHTCGGCEQPYLVRRDELGTTVTCPHDDCQRQLEVPTRDELVDAGVIQA